MAAAQLGDSLRSGRTQKSGYVQPRSFEGGPGVVIDCEQSVLFARNGVRVAFLSFGEVVVLRHFFSAQFFLCPPPSTLFLGVSGICLRNSPNIFESRVSSPFRSVPSVLRVHGSAPCVRARRSSFSPRRARKAERAFRVRIGRNVWLRMKVEDTQRAKRFCFGVSFFNFHSRAFSGALF